MMILTKIDDNIAMTMMITLLIKAGDKRDINSDRLAMIMMRINWDYLPKIMII